MTKDSWGYWLFARVFAETGRLIVVERSPIYVIYLSLFLPLGYPLASIAEYFVTYFISLSILVWFFKRYLSTPLSLFAILLWLPYMQLSEPPVLTLGLAISCLAVGLREKNKGAKSTVWFYSLLIFAYLLRPTYLLMIPIFLIYDIYKWKKSRQKLYLPRLTFQSLKTFWPLLTLLIMFLLFNIFESPFAWNTVYFASSKWFPNDGKTEEIIQNYNVSYIFQKYGTADGHDFYYTNQELFKGAKNSVEALKNNPEFVLTQMGKYFIEAPNMIAKMTIPYNYYKNNSHAYLASLIIITLIITGAWTYAKTSSLKLFIIASLLMDAAAIAFSPQYRYLIFPLIPLFFFASVYFARILSRLFRLKNRAGKIFSICLTALFLLILSPNFTGLNYYYVYHLDWLPIFRLIREDTKTNNLRILDGRLTNTTQSMKSSFNQIAPLIKNCRGIMSLEHIFWGAFVKIPLTGIHDIWEIPPFGNFESGVYNGLTTEKINCILVSRDLDLYEGYATTQKSRYHNYIKPYMEKLVSLGGKSYDIPAYGKVVILEK